MDKLMALTLEVPIKSVGNVIHQREVVFDVYRDFNKYCISPRLSEIERRLADLPKNLEFTLKNNQTVVETIEENDLRIINALVQQLYEMHMIMH